MADPEEASGAACHGLRRDQGDIRQTLRTAGDMEWRMDGWRQRDGPRSIRHSVAEKLKLVAILEAIITTSNK